MGLIFAIIMVFFVTAALMGNGIGSLHAQDYKAPYVVENASHFAIERVFTGVNDSTNMAF